MQPAEVNQWVQQEQARIASEKVSQIAQNIEADVLAATGIAKLSPDEKYYDYVKRAFNQLKQATLETPDMKTLKDTHKNELETLRTKYEGPLKEKEVRAAINALPLNFEGDALAQMQELLLNRALSMPHRLDEHFNLVFQIKGPDGTTMIDAHDPATNTPFKVADYLANQFKGFLKAPAPAPTGTGTNPATPPATGIPRTVKELQDQLLAEGFKPGKEYTAELKKRATEYAIKA